MRRDSRPAARECPAGRCADSYSTSDVTATTQAGWDAGTPTIAFTMPNNVDGSATFATRVIEITTANNAIPAGTEVEFTVANVENPPGVIAANNVQAETLTGTDARIDGGNTASQLELGPVTAPTTNAGASVTYVAADRKLTFTVQTAKMKQEEQVVFTITNVFAAVTKRQQQWWKRNEEKSADGSKRRNNGLYCFAKAPKCIGRV